MPPNQRPQNHEDQVKLTSRAAICILECHSKTNSEYLRISGANAELRSAEIIPGSVRLKLNHTHPASRNVDPAPGNSDTTY
jgi:hypothetical protein